MPPDFVPNLAQVADVWLEHVEFDKNRKFDFGTHGAQWSLEVQDGEIEVTDAGATTSILMSIRWDPVEEVPFETPFTLSIGVGGRFNWTDEQFDESYRRGWTEFNGLYLLWPYIRSYVSMITGAAQLPPFYLPTLAVPSVTAKPGDTVEFHAAAPGSPAETDPAV